MKLLTEKKLNALKWSRLIDEACTAKQCADTYNSALKFYCDNGYSYSEIIELAKIFLCKTIEVVKKRGYEIIWHEENRIQYLKR